MIRPFTKKLSYKIKRASKPLLYLTIVFALLLQVISSAFLTTPGVGASLAPNITQTESETEVRKPWERPVSCLSRIVPSR